MKWSKEKIRYVIFAFDILHLVSVLFALFIWFIWFKEFKEFICGVFISCVNKVSEDATKPITAVSGNLQIQQKTRVHLVQSINLSVFFILATAQCFSSLH